ncbi:hypothetical protein IJH16_00350 [Candidatus Saccharibacteria bacterium]|nr:hypothetical protein [Candidatus Saccharibacteria bacterium]
MLTPRGILFVAGDGGCKYYSYKETLTMESDEYRFGKEVLIAIGRILYGQLSTKHTAELLRDAGISDSKLDEMYVDAALNLELVYGCADIHKGEDILADLGEMHLDPLSLMTNDEQLMFAEIVGIKESGYMQESKTQEEIIQEIKQRHEQYVKELQSTDWQQRLESVKEKGRL